MDRVVDQTPAGGVVVDIGAGTGKLTAALVSRGFAVVAVDPSADMLDQLVLDGNRGETLEHRHQEVLGRSGDEPDDNR